MRDRIVIQVKNLAVDVPARTTLGIDHRRNQFHRIEGANFNLGHLIGSAAKVLVNAILTEGIVLSDSRLQHSRIITNLLSQLRNGIRLDNQTRLNLRQVAFGESRIDLACQTGSLIKDGVHRRGANLILVHAVVGNKAMTGTGALIAETLAIRADINDRSASGHVLTHALKRNLSRAFKRPVAQEAAGKRAHVPQLRADFLRHDDAVAGVVGSAVRIHHIVLQIVLHHLRIILKTAGRQNNAVLRADVEQLAFFSICTPRMVLVAGS